MRIDPAIPEHDAARPSHGNALRIRSERDPTQTARHDADGFVPATDEDLWEGTEIDVRRTVL